MYFAVVGLPAEFVLQDGQVAFEQVPVDLPGRPVTPGAARNCPNRVIARMPW